MKRSLLAAVCAAAATSTVLATPAPSNAADPFGQTYANAYYNSSGTCTFGTDSGNSAPSKILKPNVKTVAKGTRTQTWTGSTAEDTITSSQFTSSTTKFTVKDKKFAKFSGTYAEKTTQTRALGSASSCTVTGSASTIAFAEVRVGKGTLKFHLKSTGSKSAMGLVYVINMETQKVYVTTATGGSTTTLTVPVRAAGKYGIQAGVQTGSLFGSTPPNTSLTTTITGTFVKGGR